MLDKNKFHLVMRLCFQITLTLFLIAAGKAHAVNLVQNPGFDKNLEGWVWGAEPGTEATGLVDASVSHGGTSSFKMTNATAYSPNKYAKLYQKIPGLKANTTYRIGTWCKGQGVGHVWIGGGPGWRLRKFTPTGDFDWQWVSMDYTTDAEEKEFALIICTESTTREVWIDDVEMAQVGQSDTPRIYGPKIEPQLSASARLYPAFPSSSKDQTPTVQIFSKDRKFGTKAKLDWDQQFLMFHLDIRQSGPGTYCEGINLWKGDSVQIALDRRPEEPKTAYTGTCYELGFALRPDGTVDHFAWQAGGGSQFEGTGARTEGKRTPTGYTLDIALPWTSLHIDPAHLPEKIGVNVLINNTQQGREFVEWTPATGEWKRPDRFAMVYLVRPETTPSVTSLILPETQYDDNGWIEGHYREYALISLPEERSDLVAISDSGEKIKLFSTPLPKIAPRQTRTFSFMMPAKSIKEGQYRLAVQVKDKNRATAPLVRMDMATQIVRHVDKAKAQLKQIDDLLKQRPELTSDAYINAGVFLGNRFIKRVQAGGQNEVKDTPEWRWLMISETCNVLEQTQKLIGERIKPMRAPRLTGGPITIREGIFYTDTDLGPGTPVVNRPYYFYGYLGWGRVTEDFPNFWTLGATSAQKENGPMLFLKPDGTHQKADRGPSSELYQAARHRMKIDMLLSPHYFPKWILEKYPDTAGDFCGVFNPDHPKAREVHQTFLENYLPILKDDPGLLSICVSNEPGYHQSGRDPYSRPAWIDYLKNTHKTSEALNACYETHYASFEQVPVPELKMPEELNKKRAYWDWVRFNQFHLADWHRWNNGICKKILPTVPTHAKIVPFLLGWGDGDITSGVDPELITEITDLAGNDCESNSTPGGAYVWQWQLQEIYYDLLFSFGGKPVFNSENHLMPGDQPPGHYSPEHTRATLWQGALHHQGATAIWVWEEPCAISLRGGLYRRPANIYAASQAMFDLNRLAPEVAAVSSLTPRIALLYSMPCFFWEKDYYASMVKLYTAATFLGQPVTFVSERQLESGKFASVDWIILPHTTHVTNTTVKALAQFTQKGGKIIPAGQECLAFDEYHRKRPVLNLEFQTPPLDISKDEKTVGLALRKVLTAQGLSPLLLINGEDNSPVWGIEYRIVSRPHNILISLMNFLEQKQRVQIPVNGRATDLVTGKQVDLNNLSLESMEPCLIQVKTK